MSGSQNSGLNWSTPWYSAVLVCREARWIFFLDGPMTDFTFEKNDVRFARCFDYEK